MWNMIPNPEDNAVSDEFKRVSRELRGIYSADIEGPAKRVEAINHPSFTVLCRDQTGWVQRGPVGSSEEALKIAERAMQEPSISAVYIFEVAAKWERQWVKVSDE